MKKSYFNVTLVLASATISFGQVQNLREYSELGMEYEIIQAPRCASPQEIIANRNVLFSEDFSNGFNGQGSNGAWTTAGTNGDVWRSRTEAVPSSGEFSLGSPEFQSATADNGYMTFDADSANTALAPNYIPLNGELISPVFDMQSAQSAMIVLEQDARRCCGPTDAPMFFAYSTDGGSSWSDPIPLMFGLMTNFYYSSLNGGTTASFDISGIAGSSTARIKFIFDGTTTTNTHYYWAIDDISITELPDHDLRLLSTWIFGENNEGLEYGRVPEDMQDDNYIVGGLVQNFGSLTQTNLSLDANFSAFTAQASADSLPSGDTTFLESTNAISLTPGLYSGSYVITSLNDNDSLSAPQIFADNQGLRNFYIDQPVQSSNSNNPTLYALDGLGIHPENQVILSTLGTNSFSGAEDGLFLATEYRIKETAPVIGIRVLLGNSTQAGTDQIIGSIRGRNAFLNQEAGEVFETEPVSISQTDINNGFVDVMFSPGQAPLLDAGNYYAGVELYSSNGENHIYVLDDLTITQPFAASIISIAGDPNHYYTNGEALGIQLIMGEDLSGINENTLQGISIYPNPSSGGIFTVSNENDFNTKIAVYDLIGKEIYTTEVVGSETIDLSNMKTGTYVIKVVGDERTYTEKVVVK